MRVQLLMAIRSSVAITPALPKSHTKALRCMSDLALYSSSLYPLSWASLNPLRRKSNWDKGAKSKDAKGTTGSTFFVFPASARHRFSSECLVPWRVAACSKPLVRSPVCSLPSCYANISTSICTSYSSSGRPGGRWTGNADRLAARCT